MALEKQKVAQSFRGCENFDLKKKKNLILLHPVGKVKRDGRQLKLLRRKSRNNQSKTFRRTVVVVSARAGYDKSFLLTQL